MSESITFRGAHIRYFDGRQEEGGAFVRIHLTSEFSSNVMEEMGWQDPGRSATDAKLDGELLGTHLILTPGDKDLQSREIQFDIRSVEDFKVVTIEKDEVKRRELRFVARSSAAGVAALVDEYIRRVGDHQGALKVSYVKQDKLDLQDKDATPKPKKEKSGCKHCDAAIPLMEKDDAEHVNGQPCKVWEASNPAGKDAPIVGAEPSLAGATAAERKKARQAEEAKKRELRENIAGGEWPTPNDCGVYEADPLMILEFMGKKCAASIEFLQIGPDQWVASTHVSTSDASHGSPLMATTVYPSKEIAIAVEAYREMEHANGVANATDKPAAKKQWESLYDWFLDQGARASDGVVDAPDGWITADYTVAEQEEVQDPDEDDYDSDLEEREMPGGFQ